MREWQLSGSAATASLLMVKVGRNDPCPCGSGIKAKRCCLARLEDLASVRRRVEGGLEDLLLELDGGSGAWADAFEDIFLGGEPFQRRLHIEEWEWFVAALPAVLRDRAALRAASAPPGSLAEILAATEIRGWWIEEALGPALFSARCMLTEDLYELELAGEVHGEPEPGRLLVGPTIDRHEGRPILIGRPVVGAREAKEDFWELIGEIAAEAEGHDVALDDRTRRALLAAACCWPEHSEHTREGEQVCEAHAIWEPVAIDEAVKLMDEWPEARRSEVEYAYDDVVCFDLEIASGLPDSPPKQRPGVRWSLCEEDKATPPILAKVEISREDQVVFLFAPTKHRLEIAEPKLREALGLVLRGEAEYDLDVPDITRRWQRDRSALFNARDSQEDVGVAGGLATSR